MSDPTPVTPKHRAASIVALIIGLPLVVTFLGLVVAGPLAPDSPPSVPSGCGAPFVDETPETRSTSRRFAEIRRFRLFDCGDRFVAVVDGVGDAESAFTDADPFVSASVALIDRFEELHERRIVVSGDGDPSMSTQRGGSAGVEPAPTSDVGFDGTSLIVEFPRGRGEEILVRVEVSVTERTGSSTVHDDLSAGF